MFTFNLVYGPTFVYCAPKRSSVISRGDEPGHWMRIRYPLLKDCPFATTPPSSTSSVNVKVILGLPIFTAEG